jgi:hypothetical protein
MSPSPEELARLQNVPLELKQLNQWLMWKQKEVDGKQTKVPYQINGWKADVTNSTHYNSFSACLEHISHFDGIGFVFTRNDPFSFIDLDFTTDIEASRRQILIYDTFQSYSEISPSGKGLHIICKGVVPQGRRRSSVEIYSDNRYATMTGNVYNGHSIIKDCSNILNELWVQLGENTKNKIIEEKQQEYSDEDIIQQASNAYDGELFDKLYHGDFENIYPSQSEADLALINIIQFYSKNIEQIDRIFKSSALGKRRKANRIDYKNRNIKKAFDNEPKHIDFENHNLTIEQIKAGSFNGRTSPFDGANLGSNPSPVATATKEATKEANASVAQRLEPVAHNGLDIGSNPITSTIPIPPGLLGDIAKFIYDAAPRPVPEIAIAAAIGLMAGICGRAYNVSGTGLNQYVLLLAKTGSGKEACASGIDKLMNSIMYMVPTSTSYRGPGMIQSGQALAKHFKESKCFVSVIGEFAIKLESMSESTLSSDKMLLALLLDLYNKSGFGQTLQGNIYSKKEDSVGVIESPAFSLLGESTPDRFYKIINETMIADGLLPRFLLIQYDGKRPEFNENHHTIFPSNELANKFADLVGYVEKVSFQTPRKVINVEQDIEAAKLLRAFNRYADDKINSTDKEIIAELWNRAHMKVLKLSALIAVGVNPYEPIICPQYFEWARNIIQFDIEALSKKWHDGDIGSKSSDTKQQNEVIRIIKEYHKNSWQQVSKYSDCESLYHAHIVPISYITRRLVDTAAFKTEKPTPTEAINRVIKSLLENDYIKLVNKDQMQSHGTTRKSIVISNFNILKD